MLPELRKVRRRSASGVAAFTTFAAFALAFAGVAGAAAAPPAHAATVRTLAYVVDSAGDSVRVMDPAAKTVVGTIPVGAYPYKIVVSPDGGTAYVLNYNSDTVSVIDAASSTVTHTVPVCASPFSEAMKPDGTQVWVGCYGGGISVIDTASATVTMTAGTAPGLGSIAFTGDGSTVYALYNDDGPPPGVDAIDSATGAVTRTIPLSGNPEGLTVSPDGSTLYIARWDTDALDVIDTAGGTVSATLPVGGVADDGVLNPAGTTAYNCITGKDVAVIDLASRSITATLPDECGEMAFTPDGTTLYSANGGHGLSVIDIATGAVTSTLTTGLGVPGAVGFVRVAPAASVSAVSPAQGPEAGGTTVTITGGLFTGATGVDFGGTPAASFTVDSGTQITAVAPAHTDGTFDVTVTDDNGTSATGAGDKFTYAESAPTVTGLSPSGGVSSGGTSVTITGTDLGTTSAVYFGGTAASSFTVDSDTQVTAVTRAQTNGTVDVTVTNSAGTSPATAADRFTFFSPVPVITSVSPSVGLYLGGTAVTITGIRFTGAFRVSFGGVAASYTLDSPTQITAIAPPVSSYMSPAGTSPAGMSPAGGAMLRPNLAFTVDVRVSTDVDTSAISTADRYTYTVPG
ncbi:YVTN family beta-propeller protein [Catenulispora sp. GP43]|uniref:IPT/TIG domain-containing protein n=1 Tax=Catenulispora sp. GP43 TaxID=3156263 RepID=UPI003512DE96